MPRKKKAEKASTQSIVLPIFTDRPKENPGLGFERIVPLGLRSFEITQGVERASPSASLVLGEAARHRFSAR